MLTQNSKLKKTSKKHGLRIFNFGIPAYRAASGLRTCPNAGACATGCYAQSGVYRFSNVAYAFERRLGQTKLHSFSEAMLFEISRVKADIIRIHDSGDFYDLTYIHKWLMIATLCPEAQFYAYTKQVAAFKKLEEYAKLPSNFTLIYSYGGTEDHLICTERDRHAKVFESLEELEAAGYADASGDDLVAIGPNKKIGLVYHGTKNYKNTNWKLAGGHRKKGK